MSSPEPEDFHALYQALAVYTRRHGERWDISATEILAVLEERHDHPGGSSVGIRHLPGYRARVRDLHRHRIPVDTVVRSPVDIDGVHLVTRRRGPRHGDRRS